MIVDPHRRLIRAGVPWTKKASSMDREDAFPLLPYGTGSCQAA